MRFVLATLAVLLTPCIGEILECNVLGSKLPELRLKRHLFCEYDPSVRPVTGKNATINVTVSLMPTLVDVQWKDEHLTWKTDEFDGVSVLHVKSNEIWVPDLSIFNTGDFSGSQSRIGIPTTVCHVYNNGEVTCVPALKMSSVCDTSYTYWPYDSQTCELEMGSWGHTGDEVDFHFREIPISMEHYDRNKEWLITHVMFKKILVGYTCCPNESFPKLHASINMERHSPMFHSVYITPVIVLMVITLTVLWLDSRSTERISLAALNFICHILCIYDLHWMLPVNGSDPPHILLFYRDSMLLATFAMIVTSLLRKLQATKAPAPGWIDSTVALVASNPAGRFLLQGGVQEVDDAEIDVEENSGATLDEAKGKLRSDSWRKLSIMVEWLAFFAGLFSYVVMVCLLVAMMGRPTKDTL